MNILSQLYKLGKRWRSEYSEDYIEATEPYTYRWRIFIDKEGRFSSVCDCKPEVAMELPAKGCIKSPKYLAELLKRTVWWNPESSADMDSYAVFRTQLESLKHIPEIATLLLFLNNEAELQKCKDALLAADRGIAKKIFNKAAFVVDGKSIDAYLPGIQEYFNSLTAEDEVMVTDMVTGDSGPFARLWQAVNGVRDRSKKKLGPATPISFDKSNFKSYGCDKNDNFRITIDTEFLIRRTLNRLLRVCSCIDQNRSYCYWLDVKDPELERVIAHTATGNMTETDLEELFNGSLISGHSNINVVDDNFHLMEVSKVEKRMAINYYKVTSAHDVVMRMHAYYSNIQLRDYAPGLYKLMHSIDAPGKDGVPSGLQKAMIHAIFLGIKLPKWVLYQAVRRESLDIMADKSPANRLARYCLMKWCLSYEGLEYDKELRNMKETRANLLGQLFGEIDNLYYKAMGDKNRSRMSMLFKQVLDNPAIGFGQLAGSVRIYEDKAGDAGVFYARKCKALMERLAMFDNPWRKMSYTEQADFLMGYFLTKPFGKKKEEKTDERQMELKLEATVGE